MIEYALHSVVLFVLLSSAVYVALDPEFQRAFVIRRKMSRLRRNLKLRGEHAEYGIQFEPHQTRTGWVIMYDTDVTRHVIPEWTVALVLGNRYDLEKTREKLQLR